MNKTEKIKLGTSLLKVLVAGAGKARRTRGNANDTKQNTNVSGCGGCSRSTHK